MQNAAHRMVDGPSNHLSGVGLCNFLLIQFRQTVFEFQYYIFRSVVDDFFFGHISFYSIDLKIIIELIHFVQNLFFNIYSNLNTLNKHMWYCSIFALKNFTSFYCYHVVLYLLEKVFTFKKIFCQKREETLFFVDCSETLKYLLKVVLSNYNLVFVSSRCKVFFY